MTATEFKRFMKNKTVYHNVCGWIERWGGSSPIHEYFPYEGFVVHNTVKFPKDTYYNNEKVLSKIPLRVVDIGKSFIGQLQSMKKTIVSM